jgi:hypothetical protein
VRLPRHRTVRFLVVAGGLWLGWEVYVAVSAPRRLDPALAATLEHEPLVNIAVTLGFAPEDFHIRLFQAHGVVSGVRGTTVLLNRVSSADVRRLSRFYWIQSIARRDSRPGG